ncbi:MAG: PaaI family thioesterase [Gemmatimonadaceae bacterium]
MTLQPRDPEFETRVRASFARQRFMTTLGASLDRVAPGEITIAFTHRLELTQQHGFLHAGVMTSVADSACGYAALSLMDPGVGVLSVEFKVNMLAPAVGERFVATGRVVRSGRTLTVCAGEVATERDGQSVAVLLMQATMMTVRGRDGVAD